MSTTLKIRDLLGLIGIDETSMAKGRRPKATKDSALRQASTSTAEDNQITFNDMARTQSLGTVPTAITENFRNCYIRGMTPENCWNNAVVGQPIPEDKVELYRKGCERFITDSEKNNLKTRVVEVAAELVRAEDTIALETTPANSDVDWVSARRAARNQLEKQGISPAIVLKAAELADAAYQSTPAKLQKLEAQKTHIAETTYPEALKFTDHQGALMQVKSVCSAIHISAPSATFSASLPDKLTMDQKTAIASTIQKRAEISQTHFNAARGQGLQPSRAAEQARRDLRNELGVDYAKFPDGWDYKTLEANYKAPVQQTQVPPTKVQLSVAKMGQSDNLGLTPIHFAAAIGKLTELTAFLKANPALLSVPATSMDNKTVALAASYIFNRKENSGRPNPLRHDHTGVTPAQLVIRFGHGEQLRDVGIDPATVPGLDPKKAAQLGKNGQEMLAEQYYPLSILAARTAATKQGMDFNEALSAVTVKFNKAIEKYSPAHGTNFPEYSYPLMQMSVIDEKRAQDPRSNADRAKADDLAEIKDRLAQELGRAPDSADVAEKLGISQDQLAKLEESVAKPIFTSFDAGSKNDEGQERNKHELIADEHIEEAQETSESDLEADERQAIRKGIAKVVDQLNDDHRQTFLLRFACGCPNQDVAWMMGCSAGQINAIETAVKHRLHEALENTVKGIQARRFAPAVAPKQQQTKSDSTDFGRDD